ncbi:MAG: RNA-guided endonuclease IscB, partial [Acidimicrobiales bacterium]
CNQAKGNATAAEWGHADVQDQVDRTLRDAAYMNATRYAIRNRLSAYGLPVEVSHGGVTRANRERLGLPKDHHVDAACVGASTPTALTGLGGPLALVSSQGRGTYRRANLDRYGFPRGHRPRQKSHHGFVTGDMVRARIPTGKHAGVHLGRVAVRTSGRFAIRTSSGRIDGISHRHIRLVQRNNGWTWSVLPRSDGEEGAA